MASRSRDSTVKLWDLASGSELRTLAGHTDSVESIAFNPDGRTLALGSDDNPVKLCEVASGQELRSLTGPTERVNSVAFSPDGRTLASGSDENVAFGLDGSTKTWGIVDHTIKLWDV